MTLLPKKMIHKTHAIWILKGTGDNTQENLNGISTDKLVCNRTLYGVLPSQTSFNAKRRCKKFILGKTGQVCCDPDELRWSVSNSKFQLLLPYTAAGDVFLLVTEFQTHTVKLIVQDKKTWSIIKTIVIVTILELMPYFVVWTNEIGVFHWMDQSGGCLQIHTTGCTDILKALIWKSISVLG